MGYLIGFALIYAGYSVLVWSNHTLKHRDASLWYLMSGLGTPPKAASSSPCDTSSSGGVSPTVPNYSGADHPPTPTPPPSGVPVVPAPQPAPPGP